MVLLGLLFIAKEWPRCFSPCGINLNVLDIMGLTSASFPNGRHQHLQKKKKKASTFTKKSRTNLSIGISTNFNFFIRRETPSFEFYPKTKEPEMKCVCDSSENRQILFLLFLEVAV